MIICVQFGSVKIVVSWKNIIYFPISILYPVGIAILDIRLTQK
jgi:hypothetical protein